MVRIRSQDGTLRNVDKLEAVEIIDSDGLLGMVIFNDRRDVIRALIPGDPLFTAYCRAHGLGASRVHRHDATPVQTSLG
jgi:hypothetical protein